MAISLLRSMYNLGIPVEDIGRMFVNLFSFISGESSLGDYLKSIYEIIRSDDARE